jgi:hypothetical protein
MSDISLAYSMLKLVSSPYDNFDYLTPDRTVFQCETLDTLYVVVKTMLKGEKKFVAIPLKDQREPPHGFTVIPLQPKVALCPHGLWTNGKFYQTWKKWNKNCRPMHERKKVTHVEHLTRDNGALVEQWLTRYHHSRGKDSSSERERRHKAPRVRKTARGGYLKYLHDYLREDYYVRGLKQFYQTEFVKTLLDSTTKRISEQLARERETQRLD